MIYNLPSSVIALDDNRELLDATLVLDQKLLSVVTQATGVEATQEALAI